MADTHLLTVLVACCVGVTLLVALAAISIVLILSSSLLKQVGLQIEASKALDLSRFDFEKRLALIRVKLERSSQYSRRKADFAELTLSSFHEVEVLLANARRKKLGATRSFSDYRVAKQMLDEQQPLLLKIKMRRHSAFALFGEEGAASYARLIDSVEAVRQASGLLAESEILDQKLSADTREQYEATIWSTSNGVDKTAIEMVEIMDEADRIFGTALGVPFEENTDGAIG